MNGWKWKWGSAQSWWAFFVAVFSGVLTWVGWMQYDLGKSDQRAYILLKAPAPTGQINEGRVILRILNAGKLLPATDIKATLYVARETFPQVSVFGEQKICAEHKYGLPPGVENAEHILVTLKSWSDMDWQAIMKHNQAIFMGATVTYNDGFEWDSPVSYEWCTQTNYDPVGKELIWIVCPIGQIQWLENVTAGLPCQ